jgi:hypothetical protein
MLLGAYDARAVAGPALTSTDAALASALEVTLIDDEPAAGGASEMLHKYQQQVMEENVNRTELLWHAILVVQPSACRKHSR